MPTMLFYISLLQLAFILFGASYILAESPPPLEFREYEYGPTHSGRRAVETSFKESFINSCNSYLLSANVTSDSMISQVDYTNFLIDFCIESGPCEADYTTQYDALSFDLQFEFLWADCDQGDKTCIDALLATKVDGEFGFILTNDNSDDIESIVQILCTNIYPKAKTFHGGTQAPTNVPSVAPSIKPSSTPPTDVTSITEKADPSLNRDDSFASRNAVATNKILVIFGVLAFFLA